MSGGRMQRVLGGVLVTVGLLLLLATGAYYANGLLAKSTLDDLETSSERPSLRTLDSQDNPAPIKTKEDLRKDTVATARDEPLREEPEPQIAAVTVTAPTDSPVAETMVSSTGPGNPSVATEPAVRKAALKPVVVREAAEPVVIHRVNTEPVVVRVAAEIISVQHVDEPAPSQTAPSAGSSQWDWRGVRDTSKQSQFSDDEVARVGPSIAYVNPVEKPAPGPETPPSAQVLSSTETSGNGESGTQSAAVTSTETSENGESGTQSAAVTSTETSENGESGTQSAAVTGSDTSGNGESGTQSSAVTDSDTSGNADNGTEKVAPTPTDTSGSNQPVAETVVLSPADTGEALLASYRTPDVSTSYDAAAAKSMHIPAIGLTSGVKDLQVLFNGQSSAWETPDKIVGHIPTTARPGAAGQGWYFGHLDSPVRGEGNVFRSLPKIPELTKNSPVYIFLKTDSFSYAYQVYKTEVVHHTQLAVSDSGHQDITLVTCVPRFYYDHRLLVTAALVGVKPNETHSG